MTTDAVFDVFTIAAVELEPMLADEEFMSLSLKTKALQGETVAAYGLRTAKNMLNLALLFGKTYRKNIYNILAALAGCKAEEIAAKPLGENLSFIKECLSDEELVDFFTRSAHSERKTSSDI